MMSISFVACGDKKATANDESSDNVEVGADKKEAKDEAEKTTSTDGFSEKYVDLDDLSFMVDGHKITVGVTTLQEMLDAGIKFHENDMKKIENDIEGNSSAGSYRYVTDDDWACVFEFINNTEGVKKSKDCILGFVDYSVRDNRTQDKIVFSFPLTLTEEQLLENAGEPTRKREFKSDDSDRFTNKYEYTRKSEKYIGSYGYTFKFSNKGLSTVYISFK